MNSKIFMFYLILLSMLGFLATDMYLPAFDIMQADLSFANPGTITMSMSIFLAGFAVAQLFWGLLSDSLGRKNTLLIGLTLSAIGTCGIVFTTNVYVLLVFRFIQAVGICSAAVTWQALVIDNYKANQVNRILATIMPLVALSPALAPLLGSQVLIYSSWRVIFVIILLLTLLLLFFTFYFAKQGKISNSKGALQESSEQVGFLSFFTSKYYLGNVIVYAACSASFFAWLSASPFILKDFGFLPAEIGPSYIPQTIAFLLGGYSCRYLLGRFSGSVILPWLLVVYTISIIAIFALTLAGIANFINVMTFFCVMALANGAIYPVVVGNALRIFPTSSGKAAALQNTLQLGLCFIASQFVSLWVTNALFITSIAMVTTIFLAAIGYFMQLKAKQD